MDQDRWGTVDQVLRSVLDLDHDARHAALDRACGGNGELRSEIESLLAHDSTDGFLDALALPVRQPEADPPPGWRAGPYRIIRLIASGGMGSVWLAERDDDEYRKQVAVKVLKREMSTEDVLQRFRQERQVQATLEHPNIVRLLDGGAALDGRPYLVMEYVEGEPILAHCEARGLSIRDRLRVFRKICGAVHYAHQNLVIHRDLKPSNILVTAGGEPKLLDFGIAKVCGPTGDLKEAEVTAAGQRPMTLRYASPEQFRGEPVTTATDVYSLGVILCELLAGKGPYEVSSGSMTDYERAVCDRDPKPPSEVAGGPDWRRTRTVLRGDLDAIVLKALRKEPGRRYPSAEQLSEDIERYLCGFPVGARRGTMAYRAMRFVRRNTAAAVAVTAVFVSLIGGMVATYRQAAIAERERNLSVAAGAKAQDAADAARREARRSRRIAHFLQDVLAAASPRANIRGMTAEQALDRVAARVHQDFHDEPEIESSINAVVGKTYLALGRYADAEKHLREAVGILAEAGRESTSDMADSLSDLGAIAYAKGDYDQARALTEQGLALNARCVGSEHPNVARGLNNLGAIARAQGDLDRAEDLLREALDLRHRLFGEQHVDVAESLNNLAGVFRARHDLAAAERFSREALSLRRKLLGEEHLDTIQSLNNLAVILGERRDYPAAEPLMREAVARCEARVGPDHPDLAASLHNFARVLIALEKYGEAETSLEKSLRIRRASLPQADERTLATARLLTSCKVALDKLEEAQRILEQARGDAEETLGSDHPSVQGLTRDLAGLSDGRNRPSRAAGPPR